ncbi:DUF4330 domain-containing protein [Ructibacterium gallinarum]|uniref:DUF4330 domain-containing protein n=1 Tax=Ructibacterium gallinarum TaxID=2779355 RepID=A0A9D5M441_9FIRM|nr:DUF4330 domain-containing protein [Ructibacterium gallinarum]MBE5039199.1 DUF4330 domain-containing protein [Ructibacterium gallinarum]
MLKKDGKLFGKISIIDIAVILIVVLLAAGVLIKFSGNQNVPVSSGEKLECVVQVKNVRDYTVEALKKGGPVFDKTTKEYIGTITGVTTEPGETTLLLNDGSYRNVETEGRYNAYVTIAFDGKESDGGYYTATNKQMAAGSSLGMNAKYSQCDGTIYEVRHAQ